MPHYKSVPGLMLLIFCAVPLLFFNSCSSVSTYHPSGLPSLIAFSSDSDETVRIFTVKPDSTDQQCVSLNDEALDGIPVWSPDGTKIAFTTNETGDFDLAVMDADGKNRKKLSSMRGWEGSPNWSPDGTKIAFVYARKDEAGNSNQDIFVINADGTGSKQLTANPELQATTPQEDTHSHSDSESSSQEFWWNSVPTWSPDGSKILFASNRDGDTSAPVLYIMNSDGSGQSKLNSITPVDGTDPDWSPVTNKVVMIRGSAAKSDIWVIDPSSPFPLSTATKLTTSTIDNYSQPTWSPDGTQIAFVANTYGNDDIFIMNADGTNIRRVTYDKSSDRNPSWR